MKKRMVLLLLAVLSATMLASCGPDSSKKETNNNNVISGEDNSVDSQKGNNTTDDSSNDSSQKEDTNANSDANNTTDNDSQGEIDLFANLSNYAFEYSSHAGGWSTSLSVTAKGDFAGYYLDTEYGETGDNYPDGTMYESNFTGTFVSPTKIDDYSYTIEINGITYTEEPGTENYADGMRTVYSDASGVSNAPKFVVYLPDTPVSALPQGLKDWVTPVYGEFTGDTLGYYALYNPDGEYAFVSYLLDPENDVNNNTEDSNNEEGNNESASIKDEINTVSTKDAQLLEKAKDENATQTDLTNNAKERYDLWDGELNNIWAKLSTSLSEGDFANIKEQQLQWINDRDSAMEEAASKYKGGSMENMARFDKGAQLTKERCNTLASYL